MHQHISSADQTERKRRKFCCAKESKPASHPTDRQLAFVNPLGNGQDEDRDTDADDGANFQLNLIRDDNNQTAIAVSQQDQSDSEISTSAFELETGMILG